MRKNILRLLALAASAVMLLTGCSAPKGEKAPEETPQQQVAVTAAPEGQAQKTSGVGFYFDTVVTVTLYGADETLLSEIWTLCEKYENLLSKTVIGSDVYRINHAQGEPVTVDPETWNLLKRAKEINEKTGGAFCVTIAPLSAQWDFTHGTNMMPTDEERLAALPLVDDSKLILGENNTVTLPEGMQIDLGGIAKGYIADQGAALAAGRIHGGTLNFGGNVYALGYKPDGTAFNMGLQDPEKSSGSALAVLTKTDISMVTSGIYERCFFVEDVRYHHILDPKTGLPADSDLSSVTILSPSSMDADAYATACVVLGSEKSLELLNGLGMDAVMITRSGELLFTDGFEEEYSFRML